MNSKMTARFVAFLALMLIASGCSLFEKEEKKKPEPVVLEEPKVETLRFRPTDEWMEQAQVIRTRDATIYYQGTAQGQLNEDGDWIGTIDGEVVVEHSGGMVSEADYLESKGNDAWVYRGRTKFVLRSEEPDEPDASTP